MGVGATLGAVVAAGPAQATATSPTASRETDLRNLMAILLYAAEDSQIRERRASGE
jgi:hypothetical protein